MIFERGDFSSTRIERSIVAESLRETRQFNSAGETLSGATVFLSHKHSDLDDLQGVMGMLKQFGAKIYIDSMDDKMPGKTTGETAKRIKEVIKSCRKFVLLATDSAIESYWCNWELGFGDTHKYIESIAILPMKEKDSKDHNYKGNEYLQIYPQISYYSAGVYKNGSQRKAGYYVAKPKDKESLIYLTELSEWLKQ